MEIVSDKRLQFVPQVWKRFCTALGVYYLSLGYLPQANGQTERFNQELEATLCYITTHIPGLLVHLPSMGRICSQQTHFFCYRSLTI